MNPLNLPLHMLNRVTRTNAVDISASFDPKRLTVRLRNRMIKSLEEAYIPTNAYWGVGLVAKHILDEAGVFYMAGKMRGYVWVQWGGTLPPELIAPLNELLVADHAAATLQGDGSEVQTINENRLRSHNYFHLRVLKPSDHLVPLLKPYAQAPAYRYAVEPYIRRMKDGEPIVINVKC